MPITECKVIIKDGNKKLVTEYEILEEMGPMILDMQDKNVKRMIEDSVQQFKLNPDVEAPSIVIKTTTVIQ